MKLSEVPMEKVMQALPKLSTGYANEPMVFNLVTEVEPGRVPSPNWHMGFDAAGAVFCGEGHKDEADAITFTLLQGGMSTMVGFMVDGLNGGPRSAMMSMMMGKIGITPFNPKAVKKTESFFKRLRTGEEAMKEALAAVGCAVDDFDN